MGKVKQGFLVSPKFQKRGDYLPYCVQVDRCFSGELCQTLRGIPVSAQDGFVAICPILQWNHTATDVNTTGKEHIYLYALMHYKCNIRRHFLCIQRDRLTGLTLCPQLSYL